MIAVVEEEVGGAGGTEGDGDLLIGIEQIGERQRQIVRHGGHRGGAVLGMSAGVVAADGGHRQTLLTPEVRHLDQAWADMQHEGAVIAEEHRQQGLAGEIGAADQTAIAHIGEGEVGSGRAEGNHGGEDGDHAGSLPGRGAAGKAWTVCRRREHAGMRTLLVSAPLAVGIIDLPEDERRHGVAVLRLRPGEQVRLADGAGTIGRGTVAVAGRDRLAVAVEMIEHPDDGPASLLTVAVAAPKGERLDDLVRGLTELGVGCIAPLVCVRGERLPARSERLERIAREALKQCRRAHLPVLVPAVTVAELCARGGALAVLDPQGEGVPAGPPGPTTLVIGPEGGLDASEAAALVAAGAHRVRLGRHILRIETAALAAAAVWTVAWEAWRPPALPAPTPA